MLMLYQLSITSILPGLPTHFCLLKTGKTDRELIQPNKFNSVHCEVAIMRWQELYKELQYNFLLKLRALRFSRVFVFSIQTSVNVVQWQHDGRTAEWIRQHWPFCAHCADTILALQHFAAQTSFLAIVFGNCKLFAPTEGYTSGLKTLNHAVLATIGTNYGYMRKTQQNQQNKNPNKQERNRGKYDLSSSVLYNDSQTFSSLPFRKHR